MAWPSRSLNCAMDLRAFGDDRLLAGDLGEVVDRTIDHLAVASCLADTGVHDDLDEAGDLVDVGVAELVLQLPS